MEVDNCPAALSIGGQSAPRRRNVLMEHGAESRVQFSLNSLRVRYPGPRVSQCLTSRYCADCMSIRSICAPPSQVCQASSCKLYCHLHCYLVTARATDPLPRLPGRITLPCGSSAMGLSPWTIRPRRTRLHHHGLLDTRSGQRNATVVMDWMFNPPLRDDDLVHKRCQV
jgi:hypothetical protein